MSGAPIGASPSVGTPLDALSGTLKGHEVYEDWSSYRGFNVFFIGFLITLTPFRYEYDVPVGVRFL